MKKNFCIFLSAIIILLPNCCFAEFERSAFSATAAEFRKIESVDRLIAHVNDKEWFNRAAAIVVLGERKERRAVEPLLEKFKVESDRSMLKEIVIALSEIKDARAIAPLLGELENSRDVYDYRLPEFLIAVIKETSDAKLLLPALKAGRPEVRQAAAETLDKLGWKPATKDAEVDYFVAKKDWARCQQLGATAVDALSSLLNNSYWSDDLQKIASTLGQINDPRAIEALIRVLNSQYSAIPDTIAAKLEKINDPRVIQNVKKQFKTPVNWNTQLTVAEVLGDLKNPRAIEPLMIAVKDNDERVRAKAIEALRKMKASKAQSVLVSALMDIRSPVREAAALALDEIAWKSADPKENAAYYVAKKNMEKCVELGTVAIEPLILSLSNNFDSEAKNFATAVLTKMGSPAVEPLIAVLTKINVGYDFSKNYNYEQVVTGQNVRRAVAGILGDINDPRAIEPLIKALQDDAVKDIVIAVLGKMKSPQAIDALVRLLKDENSQTRKDTAEALAQIGWKPSTDEEKAAYCIAGHWEECEKLGAPAVEPLMALLLYRPTYNGSVHVNAVVANLLVKLKDPRVIKPFVYIFSNYDPAVDENPYDLGIIRAALVEFGAAAVEPLLAAFKEPLIVVSKYSLAEKKLDWKGDFDKFLKNGWAIQISPFEALLTVDWTNVKDALSEKFGADFKQIAYILGNKHRQVIEYGYPIEGRDRIATLLAEIGDKRAIPLLAANLQDLVAYREIANALSKLGWQPGTERERIYYMINTRDKKCREEEWVTVRKILLEDVESDDDRAIRYALRAFVAMGKEEVIPKLIDILNNKSSLERAQAYSGCDNKELRAASDKWYLSHGYTFKTVFIANSGKSDGKGRAPITWGSW